MYDYFNKNFEVKEKSVGTDNNHRLILERLNKKLQSTNPYKDIKYRYYNMICI